MWFNRLTELQKSGVKILILILTLLPVLPIQGQAGTQRRIERREAAQDRKEKRDYEKRRKEVLKHRYSIQSEEVQKRMKESRKKAELFNKGAREPFYRRLFQKKRRTKKTKSPR